LLASSRVQFHLERMPDRKYFAVGETCFRSGFFGNATYRLERTLELCCGSKTCVHLFIYGIYMQYATFSLKAQAALLVRMIKSDASAGTVFVTVAQVAQQHYNRLYPFEVELYGENLNGLVRLLSYSETEHLIRVTIARFTDVHREVLWAFLADANSTWHVDRATKLLTTAEQRLAFATRLYFAVQSTGNLQRLFELLKVYPQEIKDVGLTDEQFISVKLLLLQKESDEELCVFLDALFRLLPLEEVQQIVSV
jgi:hypothetical protein